MQLSILGFEREGKVAKYGVTTEIPRVTPRLSNETSQDMCQTGRRRSAGLIKNIRTELEYISSNCRVIRYVCGKIVAFTNRIINYADATKTAVGSLLLRDIDDLDLVERGSGGVDALKIIANIPLKARIRDVDESRCVVMMVDWTLV
ncbi:hypothetical protein BDR07DRAFT_1372625 [Suillus spraguei]|nr:hypothetical protein BDR07DRAFT_1372625 [Suillus spraguei]